MEATQVRIAAKVPGRLLTFTLQEGDHVEGGQTIAEQDTTDAHLALQQAQSDLAQARAELALRLAGSRKEDIAELAALVASAQADLDGARREYDRQEKLLDEQIGTVKDRDDALARRNIAAARLEAAKQTLAKARAGSRVEEIEQSRGRVGSAQARIAQLEQQIRDATIVCPVKGVVTTKVAEQGELLSPGSILIVVSKLAEAWLTVYVTEPDLARLRIGQSADVVTDDGQRRQGKVTFIASEAEFTPKNVQTRDERIKLVFRVKIGIDNADGLFKPGMPAEARLAAAPAASDRAAQ